MPRHGASCWTLAFVVPALALLVPPPCRAQPLRDHPGFVIPALAGERWSYDEEVFGYRNRFPAPGQVLLMDVRVFTAPEACATTADLAALTRKWADSLLAAAPAGGDRVPVVAMDTTLAAPAVRYEIRRLEAFAAPGRPVRVRLTRGYRWLHPQPRLGYAEVRFSWSLEPGASPVPLTDEDLALVRGLRTVPARDLAPTNDAAFGVGSPVGGVARGFGSLWVTLPARHVLLRLDPGAGRVLDSLAIGGAPRAVLAAAGAVWAASESGPRLHRIDPVTLAVTTRDVGSHMAPKVWLTILGDRPPTSVDGLATDGTRIAVCWRDRDAVAWFDARDESPGRRVVGKRKLTAVAFAGGRLWAVDETRSEVLAIDPERAEIVGRVAGRAGYPFGAMVPCDDELWVASLPVLRVDPATVRLVGPGPPRGFALFPDSIGVWAANDLGQLLHFTVRPGPEGAREPVSLAVPVAPSAAPAEGLAVAAAGESLAVSVARAEPSPVASLAGAKRAPGFGVAEDVALGIGIVAAWSALAYAGERGEALAGITATLGNLSVMVNCETMRGGAVTFFGMLGLAAAEYALGVSGASKDALFLTSLAGLPIVVGGGYWYDRRVAEANARLRAGR